MLLSFDQPKKKVLQEINERVTILAEFVYPNTASCNGNQISPESPGYNSVQTFSSSPLPHLDNWN